MYNLLRSGIRANSLLLRTSGSSAQSHPSLFKNLSTEASPPPPPPAEEDVFLRSPGTSKTYGRLWGAKKHTLKTDVVSLLQDCNLSLDDVKVDYNGNYMPISMMLQFHSGQAYNSALRSVRKSQLYKLERADRSNWDAVPSYGGKAILLQGIPRNALPDDIDRFLSGCEFDPSSMRLFTRPGFPDPVRMAVVHFPSPTQAMSAYLTKNRGFCLNNQILIRVLQ